jgi:hypothetical protein
MPRSLRAGRGLDDWTDRCVEIAVGGLGTLANSPQGRLAQDPLLRRLLSAIAAQAALAARVAGFSVRGRPERAALKLCRRSPGRVHPWLCNFRRGLPTGASPLLIPLIAASARSKPTPGALAVLAATLRRLERAR